MTSRLAFFLFVAAACTWCNDVSSSRSSDEPTANAPESKNAKPDTSSSDRSPTAGLPEGWIKDIDELEARGPNKGPLVYPAMTLKLWVEKGWLVARYESLARGLEWQIVLAQATDPNPPTVRFDQPSGFEVKYGPYFIRDCVGHLRVWREHKTEKSPDWPAIAIDEGATPEHLTATLTRSKGASITTGWDVGDWRFLGCGTSSTGKSSDVRNDIWMRVQHKDAPILSTKVSSITIFPGIIELTYGDYIMHDEGDLFFGVRARWPPKRTFAVN